MPSYSRLSAASHEKSTTSRCPRLKTLGPRYRSQACAERVAVWTQLAEAIHAGVDPVRRIGRTAFRTRNPIYAPIRSLMECLSVGHGRHLEPRIARPAGHPVRTGKPRDARFTIAPGRIRPNGPAAERSDRDRQYEHRRAATTVAPHDGARGGSPRDDAAPRSARRRDFAAPSALIDAAGPGVDRNSPRIRHERSYHRSRIGGSG